MSLTAAQIVADACAMAKCPGYTAIGGRQLNLTLQDLWMHRNLKVNLVVSSITMAPNTFGPVNLEATYARTYDLFYMVSGEPFFLNQASLREYDLENLQSGLGGYPYEFATDLSAVASGGVGLLYIYPQFNVQTTMTHRYYNKQADIATPETSATVPWFEDQDYLIQATAARLMRVTDDDRYQAWQADCEILLRKHLLMEGDEQSVVKEVQLDPRRFKVGGSSRPTKLDPW
jgi:hypothetical protein